ncbi:MAG TPA: hypothetical protein VG935_05225 [Patescibacteria group bacterium]|nr:hypothetical protein [Patescibacteria group bacterium]
MTTYKTRIATAIATGSVLLQAVAGLTFASTSITLSTNGADSNNTANITHSSNTTVVQNNTANITNNVDVNSSTGGNDADKNTGGTVKVDTGNATTNVTVSNSANQNAANVQGCGCGDGDTNVTIDKNGAESSNSVDLNSNNTVGVFQNNTANVGNNVNVHANTGDNDAYKNTGGGVSVTTGDTNTTVNLTTNADANTAVVGGGSDGQGGGISAVIMKNGADSDNNIGLGFDNNMIVSQDNSAGVSNKVDVYGNTGGNDANKNTGGNAKVDTGNANADVSVDNNVNFNAADVSNCACLDDVSADIDTNGAESSNNIDASFGFNEGKDAGTFQTNDAGVTNKLDDIKGKTGYNDVNENTGNPNGDPSAVTGDANSDVTVGTNANVNSYGPGGDIQFPHMDVHFDFDLNDLLGYLMSH